MSDYSCKLSARWLHGAAYSSRLRSALFAALKTTSKTFAHRRLLTVDESTDLGAVKVTELTEDFVLSGIHAKRCRDHNAVSCQSTLISVTPD